MDVINSNIPAQRKICVQKYVELARNLQKSGCEVHFAVLPYREEALAGKPDPALYGEVLNLAEALKPLGVPLDFPIDFFKGKGSAKEIFHDKVHLFKKGHQLYAEHLAQYLSANSIKLKGDLNSAP